MAPRFTLLTLALLAIASCGKPGSGQISPPSNWPIAGLTLPAGAHDAEFSPGPGQELLNHLPRKPRLGEAKAPGPMPGQWSAFFAFSGEPAKVFEHVDHLLVAKNYSLDPQEIEIGNPGESRIHTYISPDKAYSVSLRYWKVSDTPGAKPYHLLVRDIKTPPAP